MNDLLMASGEYRVRLLLPDDVGDRYLSWLHDPAVTRYLSVGRNPPASVEDLRRWAATFDNTRTFLFGIFAEHGACHIGNVTLYLSDSDPGSAHYGVMVGDRSYWGKAVVTTVMPLIIDFAFERLGLIKMTAGADVRNVGAIITIKKLGFRDDGIYKAHVQEGNRSFDTLLYALSKAQWQQHRPRITTLSDVTLTSSVRLDQRGAL